MRYIHDTEIMQDASSVVALGNFDGVHMGHRKLIETAKKQAQMDHLQSIVFSFYPHPSFVLENMTPIGLIFSQEEKKKRLQEMGIDLYIEYPFTKAFATISPETFVEDILVRQLKVQTVVVGENYRFGKKKAGTPKYLIDKGNELGFEVIIIPPVKWENEMVSSTRIREKLKVGEIEEVNRLLNVPYSIIGKVQKGRRIGTNLLGFPTANIFADSMRLFPPNGVYVTQTYWHEKIYQSVTNIGYNPTVGGKNKVIETFLLDFEDNLYDEIIEVQFLKWLRQEQKFQSLEELIDQMKKDVQKCRVFHDMI